MPGSLPRLVRAGLPAGGLRHGRVRDIIQFCGQVLRRRRPRECAHQRALNTGGYALVDSVSCARAGSCTAGGTYADGKDWPFSGHLHGFAVTERNGRWGTAIPVPGLAALTKNGTNTEVTSVSCASAGTCAAGGYYTDRSDFIRPFVASQHNGRWGTAIPVPGLAALNKGSRQPFSLATFFPVVACAPAGPCTAVGAYTDASNHAQGYLTQAR